MPPVLKRVGPTTLTTTLSTNLYNQSNTTVMDILRQVHVANTSTGATTFSIWLGASGANAAGTELFKKRNVPAQDVYDWFGSIPLLSTDFLVGGADVNASVLSLILVVERVPV